MTIELKYVRDAGSDALEDASRAALAQIAEKDYDADALPACADGRLRWGVAFSGKHVIASCERTG